MGNIDLILAVVAALGLGMILLSVFYFRSGYSASVVDTEDAEDLLLAGAVLIIASVVMWLAYRLL